MADHLSQVNFYVLSRQTCLQYLDSRDVIQSGLGLKTEIWGFEASCLQSPILDHQHGLQQIIPILFKERLRSH